MFTTSITAIMIIAIAFFGMVNPDMRLSYDGGALVVNTQRNVSFQLNGVIWQGTLFDHEYGHYLQQIERGSMAYYATVAIPSLCSLAVFAAIWATGSDVDVEAYYRLPWEAEADRLGASKE